MVRLVLVFVPLAVWTAFAAIAIGYKLITGKIHPWLRDKE